MNNKISYVKVKDVCDFENGDRGNNYPSGNDFVKTGIPFINGGLIDNGNVVLDGMNYIIEKKFNSLRAGKAYKGDIFWSIRGSFGKVAICPFDKAAIASALVIVRPKESSDTLYIYYMMNSPYFTKQCNNSDNGSVQANLSVDTAKEFTIPWLIGEERATFINCLSLVDSMISNNNAICADLEAIAKLLYDYWFIQFDFPDENGKSYKSSGGKMVWNEELKREIPEGWEVKSLAAFIAESKNGDWGNDVPARDDDIQVTCFRGADFASITDDYQVTAPTRYISAKNADRLLSDGDLVTEISGGSPTQATGRVGYINQKFLDRNGGKMDCSNFCKAFTPINRIYQYWLYQTWKMYYDAGAMFNYESKTTGIKNLMFDEFIAWVHVPAPKNERILNEYQWICSQLYNGVQGEFIENSELASLRDFLLPMLMNGQVKVGGTDDKPPVAYPTGEAVEELIAAEPHKTYDTEG